MTNSTVSFACLAGTHDLCAHQWKNDGGARTSGCQCHEDPKPAPPSDVMDFVSAFRRVFLACIPHPIEPDWDPVYAPRLAGFPVNICYASLRGEMGPEYATVQPNRAHIDAGGLGLEGPKNLTQFGNSLLTGKNTGNFLFSAPKLRHHRGYRTHSAGLVDVTAF